MNKQDQIDMNEDVMHFFNMAVKEYQNARIYGNFTTKQLRYCSAEVIETDNFYLLRSYHTLIACICKSNDTCYDALRHEYGYTPTSAGHIAKFRHDYGAGMWGCADTETFRWVKE